MELDKAFAQSSKVGSHKAMSAHLYCCCCRHVIWPTELQPHGQESLVVTQAWHKGRHHRVIQQGELHQLHTNVIAHTAGIIRAHT